jgi:hypothetical protein
LQEENILDSGAGPSLDARMSALREPMVSLPERIDHAVLDARVT